MVAGIIVDRLDPLAGAIPAVPVIGFWLTFLLDRCCVGHRRQIDERAVAFYVLQNIFKERGTTSSCRNIVTLRFFPSLNKALIAALSRERAWNGLGMRPLAVHVSTSRAIISLIIA